MYSGLKKRILFGVSFSHSCHLCCLGSQADAGPGKVLIKQNLPATPCTDLEDNVLPWMLRSKLDDFMLMPQVKSCGGAVLVFRFYPFLHLCQSCFFSPAPALHSLFCCEALGCLATAQLPVYGKVWECYIGETVL